MAPQDSVWNKLYKLLILIHNFQLPSGNVQLEHPLIMEFQLQRFETSSNLMAEFNMAPIHINKENSQLILLFRTVLSYLIHIKPDIHIELFAFYYYTVFM